MHKPLNDFQVYDKFVYYLRILVGNSYADNDNNQMSPNVYLLFYYTAP